MKTLYTKEQLLKAIELARTITDDTKEIFDVESISGLTEICTYGLKNLYSKNEIIDLISFCAK